jgi:putative modified peptide
MSHATLTTAETLKLLLELATNDAFRERYAEKPAAALVELGVPYTTVVNLDAACLAPCKLASKEEFAESHRQFQGSDVARTQSMAIPQLRLTRGN